MAAAHPRRIVGRWSEGVALDVHSIASVPVGGGSEAHTHFETQRTEIGELVFRLKNRNDASGVSALADAAAHCIRARGWRVDAIVPVPPTKSRSLQPVLLIAEEIGQRLGIAVLDGAVAKVKVTPQMKDVPVKQRGALLADAYAVDVAALRGKSVLLFDDLYETGSSMKALADKLLDEAQVKALVALALTITRLSVTP